MDQNAFRSLLSKPRPSESSSSSARGVLGGPAPKRGWGIKPKPGHEYKDPSNDAGDAAPAFKPRQQGKKPGTSGESIRIERKCDDEASMMSISRQVEQLLEDLEKRNAEEGADAGEIEKQRAYLGGDATHSILVKGLDYALLAARKAELAREGEEIADEELDELARSKKPKVDAGKTKEKDAKMEERDKEKATLGKGFKSIRPKEEPKGEKKKKKKKKLKVGSTDAPPTDPQPAQSTPSEALQPDPSLQPTPPNSHAGPSVPAPSQPLPSKPKEPTPPPIVDDEDIFGDVGTYDLNAVLPDESDDEDSEDEKMDGDDVRSRSGSRSGYGYGDGSRDRDRSRSRSRDRSGSSDRRRYHSRSDSRVRHDHHDGYGRRDYYDRHRPLSRSRSRSREVYPSSRVYRDRSYSPRRYDSRRSRSPQRSRYQTNRPGPRGRDYTRSNLRSPYHRRDGHSSSPPPRDHSPAPRRIPTRSPSPMHFDPHAGPPPRSPSPSGSSDTSLPPTTSTSKLRPLASSSIQDVKTFLSADAHAAKLEEKRLQKAKWRAKQGLPQQEGIGAGGGGEKSMNEKQKQNRDYVLLMNKLGKDGKAAGGGKRDE